MLKRHVVSVTTDAGGAATALSPIITGNLLSIGYLKDTGANPFANGVDFTITSSVSLQNLWVQNDVNASVRVNPRGPINDTVGGAIAGGSDYIRLIKEQVKIVIAQGGATKVGAFEIVVDDQN